MKYEGGEATTKTSHRVSCLTFLLNICVGPETQGRLSVDETHPTNSLQQMSLPCWELCSRVDSSEERTRDLLTSRFLSPRKCCNRLVSLTNRKLVPAAGREQGQLSRYPEEIKNSNTTLLPARSWGGKETSSCSSLSHMGHELLFQWSYVRPGVSMDALPAKLEMVSLHKIKCQNQQQATLFFLLPQRPFYC